MLKKSKIGGIAFFLFLLVCSFLVSAFSQEVFAHLVAKKMPLTNLTVVIDAGHGGIDVGAVGRVYKTAESDINLSLSKILETSLKRIGIKVVQTRENKEGLYTNFGKHYKREDMQARQKIIKNAEADAVISLHQNSYTLSSKRGSQVFFQEKSVEGEKFALDVTSALKKVLETKTYLPSSADYYILNCSSVPSILVEGGYLTNADDEKLLLSKEYQSKLAYAIFCGIVKYFGIVNY